MAKKTASRHSGGYLSSKPWTKADVTALFEDNKEFRKMALRAQQKMSGNRASTRAQAKTLALAMVAPSTAAGKKTGKYPHPGAMLSWIAAFNPGSFAAAGAGSEKFSAMMAAIFNGGFRSPTKAAGAWAKFLGAINVSIETLPFFFRRNVNVLPTRKGGEHLGLRLKSIKVRIPVSPVLTADGDVVPARNIIRDIDFTTSENEANFGTVMLGITSDCKSMWIASQKGHGIRMSDLLGSKTRLTGTATSGAPAKFGGTYYPGSNVKSKEPARLKKYLAMKEAGGGTIGDA